MARLAVAVIKRLKMEDDRFSVVPFGGVFRARELVLDSFQKTLQAIAPQAKVIKPRFEPVVGGILLALNQLGIQIESSIISNIEESSQDYPQVTID